MEQGADQVAKETLQELFQKLLKAEEVVKERERRRSHRGSVSCEFRGRYSQKISVYSRNYTSGQQNT